MKMTSFQRQSNRDGGVNHGQEDLSIDLFMQRLATVNAHDQLVSLRQDAVATENKYRELFARKRESWEIEELDDPYHFLCKVFDTATTTRDSSNRLSHVDPGASYKLLQRLPHFPEDTTPRCFAIPKQKVVSVGSPAVVSREEFIFSWECLTEGQLRFLNWNNVFAAGGAVAGCLMPASTQDNEEKTGSRWTPADCFGKAIEDKRKSKVHRRRKHLHDTFLPGSDIDLFLYGLSETEA